MKKQEKILKILCLAISIMGIVMLFFPILQHAWGTYNKKHFCIDTGFSLLDFNAECMDEEALILGVFSWIQLLTAITMLILTIRNFSKKTIKTSFFYVAFILIEICGFLYLLEGIISNSISSSYSSYIYGVTLSWIPFVIISAISVVMIICLDSYKKTVPEASLSTSNSNYSHQNIEKKQQDDALFTVEGEIKTLKIYDNFLTMETKVNARAILTNNLFGGLKKLFYKNILSVQFKESSNLILGYIQFETANSSTKNNFNSENSVTFDHRKVSNEYAKQVADFVENKIININTTTVVSQKVSDADELLKFKNLLDAGIITQEEFEQKKKDLLGL